MGSDLEPNYWSCSAIRREMRIKAMNRLGSRLCVLKIVFGHAQAMLCRVVDCSKCMGQMIVVQLSFACNSELHLSTPMKILSVRSEMLFLYGVAAQPLCEPTK